MTTAAIALRARVERLRFATSADTLAVAGVALLTIVLAALTWHTWGDLNSDTGYDLVAGSRVAHGHIPYADFTYYYGPLAPFVSGLAVWIGGAGIGTGVALGFVIAIGIFAATYALARTITGPLGAFLATAFAVEVAFIPNNYSFILPHTYSATLGTLLLLVFLLFVRQYATQERTGWLFGAGAVAGVLTLTKPEVVFAAFAAGIVWLALRARAGARFRRELALFFAPALTIPALVYGALLTQVSAHTLLLDNLYPRATLHAGGNTLVKTRMPLSAHSIATIGGKLVLYVLLAAALVLIGRELSRPGRLRRPLMAACGLAFVLALGVAVAKPDGLRRGFYYFYGWIPAGIVVAVVILLVRYRRNRDRWDAPAQIELATAVALAAAAFTTYAAFVTHGWRPQMAVYYIPLAAIFLVRLHLAELARTRGAYVLGLAWLVFLVGTGTALTLKDAHAESATVTGPGGTLAAAPEDAALYRSALGWIESRTRPGDPIFVGPIMTGLYTLSGREDVLRQVSLIPSALPKPADERAAIATLQHANVRFAITDHRTWKGYGQTSFGESFDRILAGWIHDHFKHTTTIRSSGPTPRTLDVWTR